MAAGPAYFGVINYVYLDESRATDRGTAEIFYVRIADPSRSVAMSAAIDKIFANSSHETRTRSQQARAELQAKQMGDVEAFTRAIMGAILFTLAFVTGNTLRQAQSCVPGRSITCLELGTDADRCRAGQRVIR